MFVVVPPRLLLLDIAGPLEVLRQANRLQSRVRFEVRYVGPKSSLETSIGITVAAIDPLPEELPPQSWLVLAGDVEYVMLTGGGPGPGKSADDEASEKAIVKWLKATVRPRPQSDLDLYRRADRRPRWPSRRIFLHHALFNPSYEELAVIAPRARILENRLYVEDGERYSSAGITAGIDLMLHLVHQVTNQACAVGVARYLVVYLRRSGSDPQLSPWLEGRNHIHPAVHRVQDTIAADLARPWSFERAGTGRGR